MLEAVVGKLFIGARRPHGIQKIEHKDMPGFLGSAPVSIVWRKFKKNGSTAGSYTGTGI